VVAVNGGHALSTRTHTLRGYQTLDAVVDSLTPRRSPTVSEESLAAMAEARALAWVGPSTWESRCARVLEVTLDGVRVRLCVEGTEHTVVPVSAAWTLRDVPGDIVTAGALS